MKPFQERSFFHCYDCGWGEKGVHACLLSFSQAWEIIKNQSCEETANSWAQQEEGYFDFRIYQYMIDEYSFQEQDWEGSQDY